MDDVDTRILNDRDEEDMFLCDVCGDDHEILFLDSYLREAFRGHGGRDSSETGNTPFDEENTI